MLTDLDICLIALEALQDEYDALMSDDSNSISDDVKDAMRLELTGNIHHVSLKIRQLVRKAKSASGLDDCF